MKRARRKVTGLAIGATLIALPALILALIVIFLLNFDWNSAKPWLNARTSEAIGREFMIAGDLSLHWQKQAAARTAGSDGTSPSWRDRIPWPHLVARDITIANPPDMKPATAASGNTVTDPAPDRANPTGGTTADNMASIGQIDFSLNPFALLDKKIVIPQLRFDTPIITLQRRADGSNNWTFRQSDKASPWQLELQRLVFSKGRVHLVDAIRVADVTADIDTINDAPVPGKPDYGVAWKLHGKLNGEKVSGTGKAGAVLSLQQQSVPYPFMADMRVGRTEITVEGTATRPTHLAALDMRLKLAGPSMARLFAVSGILLPETPPFKTEGHLSGTLDAQHSRWTYEKFSGKVGASDIGGSLVYQSKQPRNLLSGTVVSRLLRFSDLAPVIGADSNASKSQRGVAMVQPAGKVLPVEQFKTERWTSIDADIAFSADKIIRDKDLPINKLRTKLLLKDGVLSLMPLNFDMAGGQLNATITLDGSGKAGKNAIKGSMKVSARHLQLKKLFPALPELQASVGEINGDASLSATGNSVASLLGGANGEVRTLINQGTVSKLLLEKMGLNIGSVIVMQLVGDRQVRLNCMATDFAVTNGLMQTRTFIVDTEDAIIDISGDINLAHEQLALTIKPNSKGVRVFSLRAPLYVRGNFKTPQVSIDKGVLAMRAGSALALAALAPLAALVPLVNAGPGESSACANLLAAAREKPVAPPPGKTYRPTPRGKPLTPQ